MKWSIFFLLILSACNSPISTNSVDEYTLSIDSRLGDDVDGYYTLKIDNTRLQTIHRVGGYLLKNGEEPYPPEKVVWESSHYWIMKDTTAYVIRRVLNLNGVWINVDTMYVIGYGGYQVPTINKVSYSGTGGEINTVIAPTNFMKGDTMVVSSSFRNITKTIKIILK
jgi:hypothetical protein